MKGIVGSGDIASVLTEKRNLLFFASGVSNSAEDRETEYLREMSLLHKQPKNKRLVYFSSLCIFYSTSRYAQHKRQMEELVKTFPKYTIIRLGNITWGTNPNTLINYLRTHPEAPIQDTYRYLIDKDNLLHWIERIPGFNCEMNLPGRRMTVQQVVDEFVRPIC